MKKVLAIVDALHFSELELKSYKYMADKARGVLTVLFLENIAGEAVQYAALEAGTPGYQAIFAGSMKRRAEKSVENKQRLQNFYRDNGVDVTVLEIPGAPLAGALEESRFADLLLVRNDTSFSLLTDTSPARFVKDLLTDAQCPVIVLPENVHPIRELIFAYNGTFSSAFAIRQFTQLFDTFSETPVKVVYVAEGEERRVPYGRQIKNYLNHHYEDVSHQSAEGKPAAELLALATGSTNGIVTLGAYGRSRASQFFRHSNAEAILRTAKIPVFISHP